MQMDALVDSVVELARAVTTPPSPSEPLRASLQREIAVLADALRRLGNTKRPWPSELLDDVRAATDHTVSGTAGEPSDRNAIAVGSLLDATAVDVAALVLGTNRQSVRTAPQSAIS